MKKPIYIRTAILSYTPKTITTPTINPITGRPQFESSGVIEMVDVSLEQVSAPLEAIKEGKDIEGLYLRGRLLPVGNYAPPSWLRAATECDLEMVGENSPMNGIKGKFYILQTINSRFGLESVFGYRISGIFVQRSTH